MRTIKYYIATLLIILFCTAFVTHLFAQQTTMSGDTLILNGQTKFWLNEELFFGSGTMPDKSYSYVYEAPNSLQKIINNHKRKLLTPGYKGFKSKIVKFEKEIGHNKKGYDYTILVLEMPNGARYWCDAGNAFTNHEIVLNMPGNSNTVTKSDPDYSNDSQKRKSTDVQKTTLKKKTTKAKDTNVF